MKKKIIAMVMTAIIAVGAAGCAQTATPQTGTETAAGQQEENKETGEAAEIKESTDSAEAVEVEKNGETYILCTSDVHCGVDQGFGYAGLSQVRDSLEAQGYEVILIDDGDSIQGEPMGAFTKGESIIKLMNTVGYDVAIPGNHEFDYGMDRFF